MEAVIDLHIDLRKSLGKIEDMLNEIYGSLYHTITEVYRLQTRNMVDEEIHISRVLAIERGLRKDFENLESVQNILKQIEESKDIYIKLKTAQRKNRNFMSLKDLQNALYNLE